jgi:hypothetical protein
MIALHHREIERYLQEGIERALARIGEDIIEEAAKLATQKIHEDVKHHLLYGEGGKAIRAAVHHVLAPLTAMLRAAGGEGSPDAEGLAESSDA